MTLLEFLDSHLDRRAAWRLTLLEHRLQRTPRPPFFTPQLFIACLVVALFAWALGANPDDDTMKGALIAGFAGAWGYWLGSSQGSAKANERADHGLAIAHEAMKALPPPPKADVELEPGDKVTVAADKEPVRAPGGDL